MVFVLYCYHSRNVVPPQLAKLILPSRTRVLIVIKNSISSGFPINWLRNLGILLVQTSHYLVTDMDMWPARARNAEILMDSQSVRGADLH